MAVEHLTKANADGTSFGQSATEKISMYGATPVVRASHTAAGTDAATTQTLANALRTLCINLGVMAAS